MATIEIDESEYGTLQRIRDTVNKIAAVPEGKLLIQKAHKLVEPTALTPDLDAIEAQKKLDSELQKKIDALEAKMNAEKEEREKNEHLNAANAKWESGRRALREQGYTSEGIEMVEKFMQERGIVDHEIAEAYLAKQNPPQDVLTPRAFGAFNFVEPPKDNDEFMKALFDSKGENDNAVLKAAAEAIGEVRQNRRR